MAKEKGNKIPINVTQLYQPSAKAYEVDEQGASNLYDESDSVEKAINKKVGELDDKRTNSSNTQDEGDSVEKAINKKIDELN